MNKKQKNIITDFDGEPFSTYDLGVSSALLCLGYELLSVKKDDPRRCLFLFCRTDGIEETAKLYFSNQLEVKAREFFDSIKALKSAIYN